MAAGIDMIPAPIMLVETLNTALETDALPPEEPTSSGDFSRRGSDESAAWDFSIGAI